MKWFLGNVADGFGIGIGFTLALAMLRHAGAL